MAITIQGDDPNKALQPDQTSTSSGPQTPDVGTSPSQPKPKGSGYTDIQQIAQANTNNQLGQTIGSGLQKVGQQTQQNIGQSQNQFQQNLQSSNPYLTDVGQTQQQIQSVLQDPTQATSDQINQFAQYRSGQYSGPQALANYNALQQQAQQAEQLGQNLSSTGGRVALLQRFAANPNQAYSTGQSNLDLALLGLSPQTALQQGQQATTGLTSQANAAENAAQVQAQEYQNRAKSLADYTGQQISGLENPILQNLNTQAQAATAKRDAIFSRINSGTATADDLRAVGLGSLVGQQTYGLDPSKFINETNPAAATALGVADQATAAKLHALGQLGGQTDLSNQFDTSQGQQAGTFSQNQFQGAQGLLDQYNKISSQVQQVQQNKQNQLVSESNRLTQGVDNLLGTKDFVPASLIQQYVNNPDPGLLKQIAETFLSDNRINDASSISHAHLGVSTGDIRDNTIAAIQQLANSQQSYNQQLKQLGFGQGTFAQ